MLSRSLTISNKLGLHARAAAKFVETASRHESQIEIGANGRKVNGKSIMGVMMLAASLGTDIEIFVDGEDENEALEALTHLIQDRFGEPE